MVVVVAGEALGEARGESLGLRFMVCVAGFGETVRRCSSTDEGTAGSFLFALRSLSCKKNIEKGYQ